jgi:hexosaminidase
LSYEKPILVTANQTIKAAYFENGKAKSATIEQLFTISKSTGKKIELLHQPHENYGIGGGFSLVDGMKGNTSKFGRDWLGFWGKDLHATIDLGSSISVSKVEISTLTAPASWIYYPKNITIWVAEEGENFEQVATITAEEMEQNNGKLVVDFDKQRVQKIRVIAQNNGIIPDGKPGAGSNSWLFVDEISIE